MNGSLEEARLAAARGAALLDQQEPGWLERVNLEELHMRDCSTCILGQLYGHFADGVMALELLRASHFGFEISFKRGSDVEEADLSACARYDALQTAWLELVEQRRQALLSPSVSPDPPAPPEGFPADGPPKPFPP